MRTAFKLLPVVAGIFAAAFAAPSHAVGGPSGLKVGYAVQGTLGETIVNPYGLAPLTAVIRNGGYVLKHATVRIVPKEGGQEIKYDVGPQTLRTHGGIPVFGLYAGWRNTVEVTYTRVFQGEEKTVTESYVINTQPAWLETTGNPAIAPELPDGQGDDARAQGILRSPLLHQQSRRSRCARESRGLEQSRGRRPAVEQSAAKRDSRHEGRDPPGT